MAACCAERAPNCSAWPPTRRARTRTLSSAPGAHQAASLGAVDDAWLGAHRAALTERRDLLTALIGAHLPAWRTRPPDAGLSLWAELPLDNADAFTLAAARHGVTVMAGSAACADARHGQFVRLSFAEQPSTLELAVERLAAAWELHAETLAASPAR